jgi:hypothetical protein
MARRRQRAGFNGDEPIYLARDINAAEEEAFGAAGNA